MTAFDAQHPPPSGGDGRIAETTAPHVGSTMSATREAFRRVIEQVPELHRLVHYTQSDWDFSVGVPSEIDFDTVGGNLIAALTRLNNLLAPVGTGALIRAVAHAEQGALMCNTIMQGERVLGVALAPAGRRSLLDPSTRRADIAIGELVTVLRAGFGQREQNPGGYDFTKLPIDPLTWEPPETAGTDLEARVDAVLHPRDLQFVALVHDGSIRFQRDLFDHPEAEVFFRAGYTPALRREFYLRFAPEVKQHACEIGGIVNGAIGRGMERLVLDVQRGAIYYYRVGLRTYLIGITLNQDFVTLADLKTEWLSRLPVPPGDQ